MLTPPATVRRGRDRSWRASTTEGQLYATRGRGSNRPRRETVARGLSNAAIGRELFIAEATVKTHLLRAFAKLGVDDRTAAVTVARERGWLT